MKHYQPCFALTLAFIRQTVLSNFFFLVILITTSTEKNNLNSSYSFFEGTEILLNKEHHCAYCFIAQEELLHLQLLFLTKNLTHIYSDFFIIALTHATMAMMSNDEATVRSLIFFSSSLKTSVQTTASRVNMKIFLLMFPYYQ